MKEMKFLGTKIALILAAAILFTLVMGSTQVHAKITFENYTNLTENSTKAFQALESAAFDIESMEEADFNTRRVNDDLLEAKDLFEVQLEIEQKTNTSDYTFVFEKTDLIKELADEAFEVNDELAVLEYRINDSREIIDVEEPLAIYEQAKAEFNNERYDDALELIEETYAKISELEAEKTRTKAILTATRSLFERIVDAWKQVLIAIVVIITAVFLLYDRIFVYFIKRKTKKLELEKQIITNLIKTTEGDYFQKRKLPETTYHIKMKKFGELVRDINRQIPLLREQLEEHRGFFKKLKKNKNLKKKEKGIK